MEATAKRRGFGEWEKHGALVWDAMKCSESIVSSVFTGDLLGIEWDGVDTFEHLSLQLKEMDSIGRSDGAGGASAPATAPTEASASKKTETAMPKLAKYWTEVSSREMMV